MEAEAVLSIDRLSHIGVLTLVSLSTPFLLSHFLDNIVRNQLMVIEENGEAVNLYAYMQEKWGLNASGTPKSYEMIPKEKKLPKQKAVRSSSPVRNDLRRGRRFRGIYRCRNFEADKFRDRYGTVQPCFCCGTYKCASGL